ncbi:mCG1047893, partial [Mus musculus]
MLTHKYKLFSFEFIDNMYVKMVPLKSIFHTG